MDIHNKKSCMEFFSLLQITDSFFPIGGFTLSNGLETYVQKGIVRDVQSAGHYLRNVLLYSVLYNDLLSLKLAWEYADEYCPESIVRLDMLLTASKAPAEIRAGSKKLCARFCKMADRFIKNSSLSFDKVERYEKLIKDGVCSGHYSIIFGLFAEQSGIPKEDALAAYLYNCSSSIVNNCTKLIPLSQLDAQELLYNTRGLLAEVLGKAGTLGIEDLGMCCTGFDIRSMQHERLYTRLYIT